MKTFTKLTAIVLIIFVWSFYVDVASLGADNEDCVFESCPSTTVSDTELTDPAVGSNETLPSDNSLNLGGQGTVEGTVEGTVQGTVEENNSLGTCANGTELSPAEFYELWNNHIILPHLVVNSAKTEATLTINNPTNCTIPISLSSYKMFDQFPVISSQVLFDRTELAHFTSAGGTLSVKLPHCNVQIDAWYELAPTTLLDSNPYYYPNVPFVIAANVLDGGQFCQHEQNQPPVANAGPDQTLTLPTNSTSLDGSASTDSDGTIVSYVWDEVSGPSTVNPADVVKPNIASLVEGTYIFKLTVTDDDGASDDDTVQITVNPHGPGSCANGTELSPAEFYELWNNHIILPHLVVNSAKTEATLTINNPTNCTMPISLSSYKMFNAFPIISTQELFDRTELIHVTHAGATMSVKLPTCNVQIDAWYGLAPTTLIDSNPYYYPNVPFVIAANVLDGGQFCQHEQNHPPVADAGPDQTLTLPTNSTSLDGSGSTDSDGTIVSYVWDFVSGPSTVNPADVVKPNIASLVEGTYIFKLTVTDDDGASDDDTVQIVVGQNLVLGTCGTVITLPDIVKTGKQTDPNTYGWVWTTNPLAGNAADHEWVQVYNTENTRVVWDMGTATSSVYFVPSIDHGPLPEEAHEARLFGSNNTTGPWTAGTESTIFPNGPSNWISDNDTALWTFSQSFRYVSALSDSASNNESEDAEIDAICLTSELANQPPVANAGPDQTLTLPTNSTSLDGSGSTDSDGTIVSYVWNFVSGPSNINPDDVVKPNISSLVEGAYVFELTVTDNDGASDDDTVQITVNRAGGGGGGGNGADLSISKTANDTTASKNDEVKYTISVTNNGPESATNVKVTDNLSSDLDFVSANASVGSYNKDTGIWTIGTLTSGQTVTLEIVATVKISSGTIPNIADVVAEPNNDHNSNNNHTEVDVRVSTSSGGGGHHHHHGSTSGGSVGNNNNLAPEVLGVSTSCGLYVDKYLRIGYVNDVEAVKKVQSFLNMYQNAGLVVDGFYGPITEAAVRQFQVARKINVLTPWGIVESTGIFYLTTQTEVNNIMCPALGLPIPSPLINWSQNTGVSLPPPLPS